MEAFLIQEYIRNIPDFPKPGINFKDITPLLADGAAMTRTLLKIANHYCDLEFDLVCGAESRGFIFGVGVGMLLGKGFIPVRKKGKLPYETFSESYGLEYGSDTLEIHRDAIKPGQKVLVIDDLLATGGTCEATLSLVRQCGAEVVGCAFVIELEFLKGRERLEPHCPVFSLIQYDSESV